MDKDMSISATSSDEAKDSKPARKGSHLSVVDRYFHTMECGSTIVTKIHGDIMTFFATAYIILLNPLILDNIEDVNSNSLGMPQVATVTALATGAMTIAFGLFVRYPLGIATGLGINTLVAVTFVTNEGPAWEEVMDLIVLNGVIIVPLALTEFHTAVPHTIPSDMKAAMGVDIGLFTAMIGLINGSLVRRTPDAADTIVPVQLGTNGQIASWPIAVFVFGLIVCGIMVVCNIPGGLFIGTVLNTVIALAVETLTDAGPSFANGRPVSTGWNLAISTLPDHMDDMSDLSLAGAVDPFDSSARVGAFGATMLLSTLVLTNFSDVMRTMTGLDKRATLVDEDDVLPGIKYALVAGDTGATVDGTVSSSSNIVFVDSAAGIADSARTGLANTITGILFLVAMFFTPLYEVIPIGVATPMLVIVGAMMIGQITEIDLIRFDIALPAFLTMVTMPSIYSIISGTGIGFITSAVMTIFSGRTKFMYPLMWIVSGLLIIYPAIDPFTTLLSG